MFWRPVSDDPVTMLDFGSGQQYAQQKKPSSGTSGTLSSIDMYNNMMLHEKEQEELGLSENSDDEDKKEGDGEGASLLSIMPSANNAAAGSGDQKKLLSCMSCAGVLPSSWDENEDGQIDEQFYCLPDGAPTPRSDDNQNSGDEEHQSVCSGAIRVSVHFEYYGSKGPLREICSAGAIKKLNFKQTLKLTETFSFSYLLLPPSPFALGLFLSKSIYFIFYIFISPI